MKTYVKIHKSTTNDCYTRWDTIKHVSPGDIVVPYPQVLTMQDELNYRLAKENEFFIVISVVFDESLHMVILGDQGMYTLRWHYDLG